MNNNRKKIINLALISAIVTGGAAVTVGCDKKDEFSIVWNEELGNALSLQPGESVLLYAARDDQKAGVISYVITEGSAYATINNTGVLTVTKAAPVGQKIKVQAVSDDVKSTEIVIDVVAIKEIKLTSNPSSTILERGDSVTLNVNYKNSSDTVEDVTYRITAGGEYATLNNNVLTINSDAQDGNSVTVMAETPITSTNTLTFTVNVPEVETKYIIDADSTVTVDSTSTTNAVAIAPKVLDIDNQMQEVQLESSDLTYEVVSGQDYVTVDEEGYLTAIGHGQATIRVSYDSNDPLIAVATKNITVNAILPPEAITLGNMFTYQANNTSKGAKLGFGVNSSNGDNGKLNLGITGTHTGTTHFADTYKVNVYVDGALTPSNGYANYSNTDKSLTFTEMAVGHTLRVEVLSDTGASKEARAEFTINVNNGYNIYDMEDLMSHKTGTNVIINLLGNCVVEGNSNTIGHNNGGISAYALTYYGHTSIYGNGYNIDFSKVVNTYSGGDDSGLKLLNIKNVNDADANVLNEDINVNIYDLTLYGNNGFNMAYKEESSVKTSPTWGSFDIGINIESASQDNVIAYTENGGVKRYHSYVDINNINVYGFETGMRVQYANSKAATDFTEAKTSKISNVVIENCLESGIQTVASILTFENVKLGRMGTTGIETTPDVWWTAGENFDQAQTITFKGSYISDNHNAFNNTYAENEVGGLSDIVMGLIAGLKQDNYNFHSFVVEYIKENADDTGANGVNLIGLVFNNPEVFEDAAAGEKLENLREVLNGTVVKFEDLNGEATDIVAKITELYTAIGSGDMDSAKQHLLDLYTSRFIRINVPSGSKVETSHLAAIDSLPISQDAKDYLLANLHVGDDINVGGIIVANPMYNLIDENGNITVGGQTKALEDLTVDELVALMQVQTVTLG